jgi:hypothetical protein
MIRTIGLGVLSSCALLFSSPLVRAAEAPKLGEAGAVALHGSAFASRTSIADNAESGTYGLGARPAMDFFVTKGLSLGLAMPVSWFRFENEGEPQNALSINPTARVGVLVPLSDRVAFWPVLGVSYGSFGTEDLGGKVRYETKSGSVSVDAQFAIDLAPHWYLTLTPLSLRQSVVSISNGFVGVMGAPAVFGSSVGFGAVF